MVGPLMNVPVQTLDGLILKQRIGQTLEHYADDAADDLGKLVQGYKPSATTPHAGEPVGPDPALALIERHRTAYAEWDRLSDVWGDMSIDAPGYAEAMAASYEPGQREVAAYEALFSAQPTTLPGLAALVDYLREATDRVRIDAEPSDGERALPVIANTLRAILVTGEERARHKTSLVDMLDLTSASLGDLQALHNTADLVGGVAYAASWQSRCQVRGADDEPNAAGKLMQWLGDALTDVETAANNEARRRAPTNNDDRETRLEMLALPVIQDGDQDKTEAFARELLAHIEAERAGR